MRKEGLSCSVNSLTVLIRIAQAGTQALKLLSLGQSSLTHFFSSSFLNLMCAATGTTVAPCMSFLDAPPEVDLPLAPNGFFVMGFDLDSLVEGVPVFLVEDFFDFSALPASPSSS